MHAYYCQGRLLALQETLGVLRIPWGAVEPAVSKPVWTASLCTVAGWLGWSWGCRESVSNISRVINCDLRFK